MNSKKTSLQRFYLDCFEYLINEYDEVKQDLDKDDDKLAACKDFLRGCYDSGVIPSNAVGDYVNAIRNEA